MEEVLKQILSQLDSLNEKQEENKKFHDMVHNYMAELTQDITEIKLRIDSFERKMVKQENNQVRMENLLLEKIKGLYDNHDRFEKGGCYSGTDWRP